MNPQQYYGGQFEPQGYQKQGRSGNRRRLLVIVLVTLVALTAFLGILSASSSGSKAEQLMDSALKGEFDKSYVLLGDNLKEVYTEQRWRGEIAFLQETYKSSMLDAKAVETEEKSTKTTYRFTLKPKNDTSKTIAWVIIIEVKPEDASSYIDNYYYQSIEQ